MEASASASLTFKVASEPWEFERIHRLNYRTFVEEIPQHDGNPDGRLVDRFHDQNTYLVCLRGRDLLGMLALRCTRPFSLDQKLGGDVDRHLPPTSRQRRTVEIRLLAAEREHRGGRIFLGLIAAAGQHLIRHGYDFAVISGTTRQLKLYRHMGFEPFGHLIGTPGAMFQPMYLTKERFERLASTMYVPLESVGQTFLSALPKPPLPRPTSPDQSSPPRNISFMPGPVDVPHTVREAFTAPPLSHRSPAFLNDFQSTRAALCQLTRATNVQILSGSGTLANDVIAAQLSLAPARGLILNNGEFGRRLADHARRANLDFAELRRPWGEPFDLTDIAAALRADPRIKWLWLVHCETSTGVLNDLPAVSALCAQRNVRLCADCISSIGTTPLDLSNVSLASGISGKGLRSYPGLSLVFHNDPAPPPAPAQLPRYLDLGFYAEREGVPFTLSSNLLYALKAAVESLNPSEHFAAITRHARRIRSALVHSGFEPLADDAHASPAVISIPLPLNLSGTETGDALAEKGFHLSYRSDYLLERNWIQICLMGRYADQQVDDLLRALTTTRAPSAALD